MTFVFLPGPYGCVDVEHTLVLLRRILEGVDYIHSRGIMHRDLKVSCINTFLSILHTAFSRKPGVTAANYQTSYYKSPAHLLLRKKCADLPSG